MDITVTKIADYLECPHKYHLLWVEGRPVQVTAALGFDRSLHQALAEHYRAGGPRVQPVEHLLGELDNAWRSRDYLDTREEQEYRAEAEKALARFHEAERHNESKVVAVSERLMMPLEGHTLSAVADRVDVGADGAIRVIDYRTGRRFPPEDDGSRLANVARQSLAMARWPDRQVRVFLHGLRQGEQVEVTALEEDLESGRERLRLVGTEIEAASRFPARSGRACRWCSVKRWCRMREGR